MWINSKTQLLKYLYVDLMFITKKLFVSNSQSIKTRKKINIYPLIHRVNK